MAHALGELGQDALQAIKLVCHASRKRQPNGSTLHAELRIFGHLSSLESENLQIDSNVANSPPPDCTKTVQ
jgi:hypothetical protein